MELREFVAETLTQIAEGVVRAQKDVQVLGATVNPQGVKTTASYWYLENGSSANVQLVEFDVSLTETEASKTGARIGVLFGSIGAGAHGASEIGSNAMNRIKFNVPMVLPTTASP